MTDFLGFPDCMLCRDKGIVYYDFSIATMGPPNLPYRWCACAAGVKRKAEEPDLVDRSNENVKRLGIK